MALLFKEKIDQNSNLTKKDRATLNEISTEMNEKLTNNLDWGSGNIGYLALSEKIALYKRPKRYDSYGFENGVTLYLLKSTAKIFTDLKAKISNDEGPKKFISEFFKENKDLVRSMDKKGSSQKEMHFISDRILDISESVE